MSRCDLHTYRECSCRASGIPCRAARPAIQILEEANTKAAKHDALALVLLAAIVFAIIIGAGATVGPAAI